ncbi:MAG: inositol monophosphatase family protein [Pseudomonadota bacterium]
MLTDDFMQEIKKTIFAAAEAASHITLDYFRKNSLGHSDKQSHGRWDPVTIADQEAEKAIRAQISKDFPEHNILGEEFGLLDQGSDFEWIIDPIDGTRAFITGLPVWGILIGVSYLKKPFFGVMMQPCTGEIFYGDGKSAFLRHNNQERQLSVRLEDDISKAHFLTTSPHIFENYNMNKAFNALKDACLHTRYGTDCYGYMSLAMGCSDIVCEVGLSPYDFMPLIPILRGAGASVANFSGGDDFSKGEIIATGSEALQNQVISFMQQ